MSRWLFGGYWSAMSVESTVLQDIMLLSRAAQLVLQEEVLSELKEAELGATKLNVLRLLCRNHKQSVNDLSRFLGQTKAAASQNVDSLVTAGLVRRETDKVDRRCVWISLTRKGQRILERAEAIQGKLVRGALAGLPRAPLLKLSKGMRSLALSILSSSPTHSESCLHCCAYNDTGCVYEGSRWQCTYRLRLLSRAREG